MEGDEIARVLAEIAEALPGPVTQDRTRHIDGHPADSVPEELRLDVCLVIGGATQLVSWPGRRCPPTIQCSSRDAVGTHDGNEQDRQAAAIRFPRLGNRGSMPVQPGSGFIAEPGADRQEDAACKVN